ncbi:MAG: hypothetical protein KAT65_17105 [Methanophagales archaeon]|nr:hypothetical protein [Methanophagales archaeon]
MIDDYFEFLKKVASSDSSVKGFRLIREFIGMKKGFIRFVVELRDDSELHVFEYIDSSMHKIDYSYHWQDKEKRLITRWDNAPHHPEIETFPHHVHEGEYIKPSEEPTFVETLKKIGDRILITLTNSIILKDMKKKNK